MEEGALLQIFKTATYSTIFPHRSPYPPFPISSSSALSLTICLRPAHTMRSRAGDFGSEMTNSLREILVGATQPWTWPLMLREGALLAELWDQFSSLCSEGDCRERSCRICEVSTLSAEMRLCFGFSGSWI